MVERRRRPRGPNRFGGALAQLALGALAAAALAFAVLSRGGGFLDEARSAVDDAVSPTREVIAAPFNAARRGLASLGDHARVVEENRRLKAENARLQQWRDLALNMRDKMRRYEALLSLNADPDATVVNARVVAERRGPFVRAGVLNAGADQNVEIGHAVMGDIGLLGRVVARGKSSSRVLYLTDLNSRVPILAPRSGQAAILTGDNAGQPRIDYLPSGHGLRVGDRVVTSGDDGVLPRGLPVGEAIVDERGVWRVRLFADDAPIDYVRIVRYAFAPKPEDDPAAAPDPYATGERPLVVRPEPVAPDVPVAAASSATRRPDPIPASPPPASTLTTPAANPEVITPALPRPVSAPVRTDIIVDELPPPAASESSEPEE